MADVSRVTGIKYSTVRAWRAAGKLPVPDAPHKHSPLWKMSTISKWIRKSSDSLLTSASGGISIASSKMSTGDGGTPQMTTDEAAKMLGIDPRSVRYLIQHTTKLPATKRGRDWDIDADSVKAYMSDPSRRIRPKK